MISTVIQMTIRSSSSRTINQVIAGKDGGELKADGELLGRVQEEEGVQLIHGTQGLSL